MGVLVHFLLLPWYFFKFLFAAIILLGSIIIANALLIIAVIALFSLAENQTTLLNNSNNIGGVLSTATTFGQSIISTISNCIRPFKIAWNHAFEFLFALIRIATAGNSVAFPHFHFSSRSIEEVYPADSRFVIVDIVCDVIVPMFETFLNFVLLVGNFLLELFELFLALVHQAGGINFTFMELFVGLIIEPLLDTFDPDHCIHPFTGPLGFPGNIYHCMDCPVPVVLINQDDTTKTNALFVCYCGGDLHDTAYNLIVGCIHFQTVIDFFTSLGSKLKGVGEAIGNLETWKNVVNAIWEGIQSIWSTIEGVLPAIKSAICKIPFVCKVLGIRSIRTLRGTMIDDQYICSYDTRIEGGDPNPFCFYESEFNGMMKYVLTNYTDASIAITEQWNAANILLHTIDQFTPFKAPPPDNRTAEERRQTYHQRFYQEGDESAVAQMLRITRIFLSTSLQVWNTGQNVGPEFILQRFREENVQPHHIPIGLRKYMARAGIKPYVLPWEKAVNLDHERMHANGSPKIRFASPPPINFFASILSTTASISWNGATNAAGIVNAILQTAASVGIMVVSIVVKLAFGWIQSIFPSSLQPVYIFNPLSGLFSIFTPIYSQANTQYLSPSVFTTAWGDFADIFNDVISSALGVEIVHYIFTAASYLVLDTNNTPPYHPNITSVNAMLTVVFNCDPQAACLTVEMCNFGACDCLNGTVLTLNGYCSAIGRCKCFPMFTINSGSPSNSISANVQLDPASAGYVPENVMWPKTNFGQGLWNCILDAWNGAIPYLCTTLIWNAVQIPVYTVALRYTIGWCKCCTKLTSFLMWLSLVMSPAAVAINYTFFPTMNYCSTRSVWYCTAFLHFFRPHSTGFTDLLLFGFNIGPSIVGALLILGMILVPLFFIWMMLGALTICGIDIFNGVTYGVQHDMVTPGSKIKEE